jgi:hypothetical protein
MNRLVLHHLYATTAFDLSNNRNHGAPIDVSTTTGVYSPSFSFGSGDSQIRVEPSPTLADLGAVRAVITFNLAPGGPLSRRYNLMEGHLSFALFINPDGSLQGTILDASGAWTGAKSAPNTVRPGQWHTAELQHDGINQLQLVLDGAVVAAAYNVLGQVRSVGPHGIAVGHWPEASGVYTFEGYLREAWLYKYDPYKDVNGLFDPCCTDRKGLAEAVAKLRAAGETADSVAAKGREVLAFGYEMLAAVRGGDGAVTKRQEGLSQQAWAAFLRQDQGGFSTALGQLAALAQGRLTHGQQEAFHKRQDDLLASLPLPKEDLLGLIHTMCWDKTGVDPERLAEVASRGTKSPRDGRAPHDTTHRTPTPRSSNA